MARYVMCAEFKEASARAASKQGEAGVLAPAARRGCALRPAVPQRAAARCQVRAQLSSGASRSEAGASTCRECDLQAAALTRLR